MPVYTNDANLVSLWRLNNDANDSVGANNLTNNNSVTFSTDRVEGSHSADFESSSSQSLSIADASHVGLDITGSMSIVMRVKPESQGSDRVLMGKYNQSDNQRSYVLQLTGATNIPGGILSSNGQAGGTSIAVGATGIGTGSWTHLAMVYNGTDIRLYINGSLDSNGSNNPKTHSGGIFNGSATFRLGAVFNTAVEFYDGLMDEVAIFSRALSSTEVSDISTNGILQPWSVPLVGRGKLFGRLVR